MIGIYSKGTKIRQKAWEWPNGDHSEREGHFGSIYGIEVFGLPYISGFEFLNLPGANIKNKKL